MNWQDSFDDIADYSPPGKAGGGFSDATQSQNQSEWGFYRPLRSTIHHGKGFCSFHLYLVNIETGLEAELFFNNVQRSKSGLYSVKRHSHFARLYQDCFGQVNPGKFSKAHQLLKHFHKKECLLACRVILSKRVTGEFYYKVIEQKNGNSLETDWKLTGNSLETYWKPQHDANPQQQGLRDTNQVIVNKPIVNRVIKQSIDTSLSVSIGDKEEENQKDPKPTFVELLNQPKDGADYFDYEPDELDDLF